jgi:hypothetical protein
MSGSFLNLECLEVRVEVEGVVAAFASDAADAADAGATEGRSEVVHEKAVHPDGPRAEPPAKSETSGALPDALALVAASAIGTNTVAAKATIPTAPRTRRLIDVWNILFSLVPVDGSAL